MIPLKMHKTKNHFFYFHSYLNCVISAFNLCDLKVNFSMQVNKIIVWPASITFAYKCSTRDAVYFGLCLLNRQLHPVIAAHTTNLLSSINGWAELWPKPIKFVADLLNHAY